MSPAARVGCVLATVFACAALLGTATAQGRVANETKTARYMETIRHQPPLLLAFLREMPKGGDLHNHLSGGIYAESFLDYAARDNLCVDRTTSVLIAPPCDDSCAKYTSKPQVGCAYHDQVLYNSIIDAWSMRNWSPGDGSGHDHFFASFDKFALASHLHTGDMLAEAASRAASDHLQYLELMHTADGTRAAELGAKTEWNDDFSKLREQLLRAGINNVVADTRAQLDQDEAIRNRDLKCGTGDADPGCAVTTRYLYQVLRVLPREIVFVQILTGFELAQADPRFVGLNLVMPEDWYVPMRDFDLHMRMLDYLHRVYPKVHITLHAGELAMGLVPPEGLRFHIRESVERGHAERIGHGVSIMDERDPLQLMAEMAKRNVLVEICLTSNDLILGVKGKDHPLPVYWKQGVPVTLATDDEGVSRSDLTHEYLQAAETYSYSYTQLKRMARQSLEHSFLPGASLWREGQTFRPVAACAGTPGTKPAAVCQKFLDGSERAQMQWKLEREFAKFEMTRHQGSGSLGKSEEKD